MPPPYAIRPATLADTPALAGLLHGLGWFAYFNGMEPAQANEHVARQLSYDLADDSHLLLVAEVDRQVVAYATAHWLPYLFKAGREAYVSELFVREAWRVQGLGSALLAALENDARARGYSQRDSYQRRFFAGRGWQERENMVNFWRPL